MIFARLKNRLWLLNATIATALWGVWGAFMEIPEKSGFPATLGYCIWALTLPPVAAVALKLSEWKLETDWKSASLGTLAGLLGAGGQLVLFETLRLGPAYLVFPVISLYPALAVILSMLFLRERASRRAYTGIVLALLAGGHVWMDAGLLAIDEVCSPIQMVLDNEWIGALKHLVRPFAVDEEALGLNTILEAGPGGNFLCSTHTAEHFRSEHWEPLVWSRQRLQPWLKADGRLDSDRAREWIRSVEQKDPGPPLMAEFHQRAILQVIGKARKAAGA
jgi:uncharacterized membrane protein